MKKNMLIKIPTVKQYYMLKYPEHYNCIEVIDTAKELGAEFETVNEITDFIVKYINLIDETRGQTPNLSIPFVPSEETHPNYYSCITADIKQVSDYTRLTFHDVFALNIYEFWSYLHDCVVWKCSQTEKGREYLEKSHVYEQTKPDRGMLRKFFSKE